MEVTRKQSTPKVPKAKLSYHQIHTCTWAYQGVRNVGFSENLMCFVFLLPSSWVSSFCLITDELWSWIWWKIVKLVIFRYYNTIFHLKRSFLCVISQQHWCLPFLDGKMRPMKKSNNQNMKFQFKVTETKPFKNRSDIAWKTQYYNHRGYARGNGVHWCDTRLNGQ